MSRKLLIRILSEGQILILSSTPGEDIEAKPGARIQVVDEKYRPVEDILPKRVGNDLVIWSEDQLLGTITGFFDEGMDNVLVSNYYDPLLGDVSQIAALEPVEEDADDGIGWMTYALGGAALLGGAAYLGSDSSDESGGTSTTPQATSLGISATAGAFFSTALVEVYSADGDLLVRSSLEDGTGQITVEIPEETNYTGPVVVYITDVNGTTGDYYSEATGASTSLDGVLRLMATVVAGEDVSLSVTPLTELAARLAGVPDSPSLLAVNPLTEAQLAYNAIVAALFDIEDILDSVTAVGTADFDSSDGLNTAEIYGDLLAVFSGLEENLGGMDSSLEALLAEITVVDGVAFLSGAGGILLQEAYDTFKSGPNGTALNGESSAALVPTLIADADVIDSTVAQAGVSLEVPGVVVGDEVSLLLDGVTLTTITVDTVDADGTAVITLTQDVLEQFDGTLQELVVAVNGEDRFPIQVDIDVVNPVLEISLTDSLLTVGQTTGVTFTFNEAVSGFSNDDITLSSGSLSDVVSTDGGITWTATYTPTSNLDLTTVVIAVGNGFTDAQGNLAEDTAGVVASATLDVDTKRPILAMTLSDSTLIAGDSSTLTITLSEPVLGLSLADFELDNAVLSDLTSSADGLTWTATVTPVDDVESSLNSVRLGVDWTDESGNASLIYYSSGTYLVDTLVPTITSSTTAAAILENTTAGTLVYTIESVDANATYGISGSDSMYFTFNASTGEVRLNETADFEVRPTYELTVTATDANGNQESQQVTFSVTDIDDTAPVFISGATASLDENVGTNALVYQATTNDSDAILTFSGTDQSAFTFDAATGEVWLIADPDFETQSSYEFTITATDLAGNVESQTVTLQITDLDEIAPVFVSATTASVDENTGASGLVYTALTDDPTATLSLSGTDAASFSFDAATGEVRLIADPDFESKTSYSFTITAEDAAGNSTEQTVTLSVNDLDEVAPVFTSGTTATSINENSGGSSVIYTAAVDDSADISGGITYSLSGLDQAAFSINDSTGAVTLLADADYETKSSYSFVVTAEDAAGNSTDQTVTLAVNNLDEVAPAFTSSTTATAIDENSGGGTVIYTATVNDSGDVSGGVTFSLSGADQAAFTIDDSTGAVTLIANADFETKPSYSLVVTAEDAAGNSTDQTVTLAVNNLDEVAPVFTSSTTATAIDENGGGGTVIYTATVNDGDDISGGITYSLSGTDQAAFSINGSTGEVTLLADANYEDQSSYSFIVTAEDAAGHTVQQTVTLAINDIDEIPPEVTSTPDNLEVNDGAGAGDVVYQVVTTDDTVTYSLEGADAAYFDIDQDTGEITLLEDTDYDSKTEFTFTVVLTDPAGNETRQDVTITINDVAPSFTSGTTLDPVDENSGAGQVVYTATSDDAQATYGLAGADAAYFSIDENTGEVTLLADADHETKSQYSFTVTATDTGLNVGTIDLVLNVTDIDEQPPEFADTGSRSGGFVSVWVSDGQDGDSFGIYGQLLDSDGVAVGSEFLINTYTTDTQIAPSVTSLISGGFVVVWTSANQDEAGYSVYGQIYDESGVAVGSEFLINSFSTGDQQSASVTALADGGFIVVWQSAAQDTSGSGIYAQRYDSSGAASGSEVLVNVTVSSDQTSPTVTSLVDGGYVIAWVSDGQDGDGAGVYAQRYNANGTVVNSEFQVNTYTTSSQTDPVVAALSYGGFIVAWVSDGQDGSGTGIYFQRYNASGYSVGSETLVNDRTDQAQSNVSITSLADGGFVVVWQSDEVGFEGIYAQVYDSTGAEVGEEFQVNTSAGTSVSEPAVTWLADGGFIVSWQTDGLDGDGSGIYAQRFAADGSTVGLEYQVNTTTTGDQTSADLSSLVDNMTTTVRLDEGTGMDEVIYTPYVIDTADIDDDTDTTDSLTYSLSGEEGIEEIFSINTSTGYVTMLENADYETRSSYEFTVTATDTAGQSVDHDVVVSVRDIEEVDVIIDLVSGLTSLDTDGDRVFNADMTYNIYILVDSTSATLNLAAGQNWLSGQNLGADDTIYLVGSGTTVQTSSSTDVTSIGVVDEEGEGSNLWWGTSESDLALSIDARVITRYYNGSTDDVIWYLGGDWAEGDTPNSTQDFSVVTLDALPTRVEDDLNWS